MLLFIRKCFLWFLLLACSIFFVLYLLWKMFCSSPLAITQSQILYVPPGSTLYTVAKTLNKGGFLHYPELFILLARVEGKVHSLKAGEYELPVGITPEDLITKLATGKVILRHFTLVEGWTLKQVLAAMNTNSYLVHQASTLPANELSGKIGGPMQNAEGLLFPDTYLFAAGITDSSLLKKAFLNMERRVNDLWQKRSSDLPFKTPYSALIVASLIEKETAKPDERNKIAGVIARRLQQNMPLQIDASVIYGLGEAYTGKITKEALKVDTPYNTYLHTGLPPTPIAMPSLASIIAALHPAPGKALYYVARGDGSHVFSETLEAHHEAVKQYRQDQENKRSATGFPTVKQLELLRSYLQLRELK